MPSVSALLAYAALVATLSWSQAGYCNPDFIAYASIGHLVASDPAASVSGYWAPLYSWLMAPLFLLSVEDLIAGRLVLVVAGAAYILTVDALVVRLRGSDLVRGATLSCAVLQASLWATHLLDPDLIAAALYFAALTQLAHPNVRSDWWRGLAAGATVGLAYLGKAYMLPFFLLFAPIALVLGARWAGERPTACWRALLWTGVGALLVAGPWLLVLHDKYGGFTFSTAGPANHANLGPSQYGNDPLWNPPLAGGFILDPHFAARWSPFESWGNFGHQVMLVARNIARTLERLAGWLLMFGIAVWSYRRHMRISANAAPLQPVQPAGREFVFAVVAASLYLAGYLLIDIERRYVMPILGPLLCIAAAMLWTRMGRFTHPRQLLSGALLGALFGLQEARLLVVTALRHPQSNDHTASQHLAAGLVEAKFDGPFAASQWHCGLSIAYALGHVPQYLGTPLTRTPAERTAELESAGARYYLQFPGTPGHTDAPAPVHWPQATERLLQTKAFQNATALPVTVFERP